jgi:hypothetical protein
MSDALTLWSTRRVRCPMRLPDDGQCACLLAAGWTPSSSRVGEYVDATGDGAPRWWTRALDLIARDGAP